MYEKEADELIDLVHEGSPMRPHETRRKLVASFLTELVAASYSGCTGYTADPDGPELAADGPEEDATASGATFGPELPSIEDWARMRRDARGRG